MRSHPRLLGAVVCLTALLLGAGTAGGLSARQVQGKVVAYFTAGQAHLEKGKALLSTANKTANPALLTQANVEFQAAAQDFRLGRQFIDSNRLVAVGDSVPLASALLDSRVRAVDNLAVMGLDLCNAAQRAAAVDALFLAPASSGQPKGSQRLLSILNQAGPLITSTRADLTAAATAARSVDQSVLPTSQRAALVKAQGTLQAALAGLDSFTQLLPVIQDILGATTKRTYLILQQNPFELRAGGGYVGTYSLVTADKGALTLTKSGDTHTLPDFGKQAGSAGYVTPPGPMKDFLDTQGWSLGDSNFFPDFPDNAKAAESFAQADFGQPVNGVIAIDLYAVAALLSITGPISEPSQGVTVSSQNLLTEMVKLDLLDTNHKQVLAELAGPLVQKLTEIDAAHWPQLIGVLNQQASQRHVQLYFDTPADQTELTSLGLTGTFAFNGTADFMAPVESNFGGNKANYFLARKYKLQVTHSGNTLHHVLVEDLSFDLTSAPATYKIPYRAYFRLLTPTDASSLSLNPVKPDTHPYGSPPNGTQQLDGWQQINADVNRKGQLEVTYTWDTPWQVGADGRHVLYWQKQPGTDKDAVAVAWTEGGRTFNATTDLSVDRVLSLGADGVRVAQGQAATAQLPKLSL